METLLQKSNIDETKLKRYLRKVTASELSNLSEPCYYPSIHKYKYEILKILDLEERDIKEFTKEYWRGTKYSRFLLHNDNYTMLSVFLIWYSLRSDDKDLYLLTMLFHIVRMYSNLIHKQIQYCNTQYFKYALENVSKLHLFKREKTIPNALYFLSREFGKKYEDDIKRSDTESIGKFITESRHRISQSVKSFAEVYYKASEEKSGYQTPYEDQELGAPSEKGSRLVNQIVQKISTYKNIDEKAFDEALELSNINESMAKSIVREMVKSDYLDDMRLVLIVFLRNIEGINRLCDREFYKYVRQLIYTRSSSKTKFKDSTINLVTKIFKSGRIGRFDSMQQKDRINIVLFAAYFLTISLRNMIC